MIKKILVILKLNVIATYQLNWIVLKNQLLLFFFFISKELVEPICYFQLYENV